MEARRGYVAAGVLATLLGCFCLWRFPPDQAAFYPRCPFLTWLHLQCPGCGATRAIAALLHGNPAEAARQNAFFLTLLPFGLTYAAVFAARAWQSGEFRWPLPPRWFVPVGLALAAVFTIARNLPGHTWL